MKQRKLTSLLAVTLSLELMVSPLLPNAHAQVQPQAPAQGSSFNAADLNNAMKAIGGIYQSVSGMQNTMPPQMASDMAGMQAQQTPQPDKFFNPQKLMQIPGLGEYLAINNINPMMLDCKTLPTTLYEAKPEICRVGITNDVGINPTSQLGAMSSYYNGYFQISKMYRNFSADSNSDGQAFGIGCMNNAMNILNGFFKYRTDELDKLTTNLEAMQAQFKEASRSDLDAIEEAVAVLDGDSAIADKVRSKNPGLFDFGSRFNNPACKSMFAGEALNDKGRSGGLNSISRDIKGLMTTKLGKYSGESYSQSHGAVVEDINNVADKIAKQFELNYTPNMAAGDYSTFLKGVGGLVSSTSGVQEAIRPDLFSDVQTKFMEQSAKLVEERQMIASELGASSERAMQFLNSKNTASFEAELTTLENNIKNQCLSKNLGSTDRLLDKIYDPSASSHANKNASNFLKDKLKQILADDKTDIESKLAALKIIERDQGNRYYLKMENSYEVQEFDGNGNLKSRIVGASTKRSPSVFFSDIVKNCNAQFKGNKLNNKLTGEAAIQKLRALNQSYKTLARTQSEDIRKDLKKKLIECSGPEVANNTVSGSCTPELFNPSSAGFCANAAFSCSKNMQACSAQAEGYVKEIRDQKTARVNNYKALVQKNKMDIVKIFDTALAKYMKDGEMMRGIFGAGFSSPAGILREVPEGQRYLSEFADATGKEGSPDGKLLLEDPDKYVEMFKGNIALLKESVKKQQDQILGGDSVGTGNTPGILADHIMKTETNFKAVIEGADKIAEECRTNHDNAVKAAEAQRALQQAEMMKKNNELGEQRAKFCNLYGMARTNPEAVCGQAMNDDFITKSLEAAGLAGPQQAAAARVSVYDLTSHCRQSGNYSEKAGTTSTYTAAELCLHLTTPNSRVISDENLRKNITQLCDIRKDASKDCKAPASLPEGKHYTCTKTDYDEAETNIVAAYNVFKQSPANVTNLDAAPAYCAAGDNSGRGTGNPFTDGLQELAKQLNPAPAFGQ